MAGVRVMAFHTSVSVAVLALLWCLCGRPQMAEHGTQAREQPEQGTGADRRYGVLPGIGRRRRPGEEQQAGEIGSSQAIASSYS
jgi:hypothetical protein